MKPGSLDQLISKKAQEFAEQVRTAAAMADKEEEIRIAVERQLGFLQKEAGVKLEGKHEFTVASGRVDSVYNCVIIEYKNPSSAASRIGPGANSPGAKKVVDQIKSRFYDMRSKDTLNTLFGVGCDGNYFIFVRFYNDKWQVQDPVELNKHSAERFLWALFNLGSKGKRFEPDYLSGDFGSSEGSVASDGIRVLYDAISTTSNPKAQTFFSQWKILFGEVCGYDVDNPSDKIKKLADFYGVPGKGVKPAEMLFAVHTYYALFMKLLAGEIIGHFHKLPSLLQRIVNAPNATKLKDALSFLESGGIFKQLEVTNFLEGDLFAWYLPAWSDDIEGLIRKMTARLDQYNPGTLAEEPAESRDMLKKLYQQLFPKSVRHDLGEYYTPDWLAEHVLNELEYVGDPDKRLLDPACGSGTFLVMAITRIRSWYEKNREKLRYDEGELCKKILANVVGFDLNPLAVMAARTNYLIAIRDLVSHVDKVEIPVYLCDSVLTPSTYGGLFAGSTDAAKELKTSAARFLVPTEIATTADDVAKYAEQLEFCVRNGYEPQEFIQRCRDEGLPVSLEKLHTDLYRELVGLDKANRNGVWARIIKNAFAPLFVGRVDYVAGNPPWVNWEHLPADYRASTEPLWSYYRLFEHTGLKARLGSAKDDISILMTYVAADCYLRPEAKLGFVITQSVFKTVGGGVGFRRFALPSGESLGVESVHDLVELQPFEGATNRTATFVAVRGRRTEYPIPYYEWTRRSSVSPEMDLEQVRASVSTEMKEARPIVEDDVTSPWTTVAPGLAKTLDLLMGSSAYRARAGVCGWYNGIFWVEKLRELSGDKVLVANSATSGKKSVERVEAVLERKHLFPLLRGREIDRWHATPHLFLVAPVVVGDESKALSEGTLRRESPHTYAYLNRYREDLAARNGYKKYLAAQPFYAQYNIGPYSFAKYQVAWLRISNDLCAAVVTGAVPDNGVTAVALESLEEADYLCALMNCTPVRWAIARFSVAGTGTWGSPQILTRLAIPRFDPSNEIHAALSRDAASCRKMTSGENLEGLESHEQGIDDSSARLFRISKAELRQIQSAVSTISKRTRLRRGRDSDDEG